MRATAALPALLILAAVLLLAAGGAASAQQHGGGGAAPPQPSQQPSQQPSPRAEPLRFWNLTTLTLTQLRLAPPGSGAWGANQCDNDDDKSVSPRERLRLSGSVVPGTYDVQAGDARGRLCTIRGVELKAGGRYAFSIEDSQLTDCNRS